MAADPSAQPESVTVPAEELARLRSIEKAAGERLRVIHLLQAEIERLRSLESALEERLHAIHRLTLEVHRLRPMEEEAAKRLAIIAELELEIGKLRRFELPEQQAQRALDEIRRSWSYRLGFRPVAFLAGLIPGAGRARKRPAAGRDGS